MRLQRAQDALSVGPGVLRNSEGRALGAEDLGGCKFRV